LYLLLDIIRVIISRWIRWAGHVASMGERRNAYKVSVENHEGRSTRGKPRYRWEDNIETVYKDIGWEGMDWVM
jgi:hypothetical protein